MKGIGKVGDLVAVKACDMMSAGFIGTEYAAIHLGCGVVPFQRIQFLVRPEDKGVPRCGDVLEAVAQPPSPEATLDEDVPF